MPFQLETTYSLTHSAANINLSMLLQIITMTAKRLAVAAYLCLRRRLQMLLFTFLSETTRFRLTHKTSQWYKHSYKVGDEEQGMGRVFRSTAIEYREAVYHSDMDVVNFSSPNPSHNTNTTTNPIHPLHTST